ncbi:MAG: hypothetical protein KC431_26985, partial [Myxococcales bacterium]|nr:hypothetical protein [Myxococcales bacterium]
MSVSTARLLSIALLALAACASRPSPTGVAVDPQVDEPSGLVASATHPGVYWTHGDSGNGNWLFAIDAEGKLLARYRVAATENVDWEDITRDDAGNLWLGDIGNNDGQRRDLAVLRLVEPDPSVGPEGVGEVRVAQRVGFSYPDQQQFGGRHHTFDAESLLWWRGTLWLLTKHRGDRKTKLYRFPELGADSKQVVLELVDDDATRALWPHAFRLRLSVVLSSKLRLGLTIENTGDASFRCEEALHTYFAVGDVQQASVHGLEGTPFSEQAAEPEPKWDKKAPLRFRAETDRIFQRVPGR